MTFVLLRMIKKIIVLGRIRILIRVFFLKVEKQRSIIISCRYVYFER